MKDDFDKLLATVQDTVQRMRNGEVQFTPKKLVYEGTRVRQTNANEPECDLPSSKPAAPAMR